MQFSRCFYVQILYMGVVMYAPSVALEAGINIDIKCILLDISLTSMHMIRLVNVIIINVKNLPV